MEVPELKIEKPLENLIPENVAQLPLEEEPPELSPYAISFEKYRPDICEIDGLATGNSKAALIILRDMGVHFTDKDTFWNKSTKDIEIKPITRAGAYNVLFQGLEYDEDIFEIKHQKKKRQEDIDIRIFFNSLELTRKIYILAVRQSHFDTTKNRN